MELISHGVPAYASSGNAADANDSSYDTVWNGGNNSWLAYDLSSVDVNKRQKVALVWYNEQSMLYDYSFLNVPPVNLPTNYTIEVNSAPGGGTSPSSGWQPIVTVSNNSYHSRQHILNLGGKNWIRMNITSSTGGVSLNMDIYDTSVNMNDDFIFFGDSITALAMSHTTASGAQALNQLINAQISDHYPIVENGGIPGLQSSDGVAHIKEWLAVFPGKYVGLAYGTNDAYLSLCSNANASSIATSVYNDYTTMIQQIIAAGKVPVVPHVIWSSNSTIQQCAPAINAKLDQLPGIFPQVIMGPDLYTIFANHPEYFIDGVHTNAQGSKIYRQAWADTLVAKVYNGSTPTPTATQRRSTQI